MVAGRNFGLLRYLRENKFLRKIILACLLGDQMGSINGEKNRGQKSRDTAPLNSSGAAPKEDRFETLPSCEEVR